MRAYDKITDWFSYHTESPDSRISELLALREEIISNFTGDVLEDLLNDWNNAQERVINSIGETECNIIDFMKAIDETDSFMKVHDPEEVLQQAEEYIDSENDYLTGKETTYKGGKKSKKNNNYWRYAVIFKFKTIKIKNTIFHKLINLRINKI